MRWTIHACDHEWCATDAVAEEPDGERSRRDRQGLDRGDATEEGGIVAQLEHVEVEQQVEDGPSDPKQHGVGEELASPRAEGGEAVQQPGAYVPAGFLADLADSAGRECIA